MYSTKMRGKNEKVGQYGIQERNLNKMVPRMLGKVSPRMMAEQHALKSIQLEQGWRALGEMSPRETEIELIDYLM